MERKYAQSIRENQKDWNCAIAVLENAKDAVLLAKTLLDGELPCAEVAFGTEVAEEMIRNILELSR